MLTPRWMLRDMLCEQGAPMVGLEPVGPFYGDGIGPDHRNGNGGWHEDLTNGAGRRDTNWCDRADGDGFCEVLDDTSTSFREVNCS